MIVVSASSHALALSADALWDRAAVRRIAEARAAIAGRYVMKHRRAAESARRWHWTWRRLHVIAKCRADAHGFKHDEWGIDAGYCLDRYTIDDPKKEPQ